MTTAREVRNRATDQHGSTTEASDHGSDPGGCRRSRFHGADLRSVGEAQPRSPQGSTSSQAGERRRGGQGEPGQRRRSQPAAAPAPFPPELPPQTPPDRRQTRPGNQGGQDRRRPIRRENVRSRGPAGRGRVGRRPPAGRHLPPLTIVRVSRAAPLTAPGAWRASALFTSLLSQQYFFFFCQQEETSNKI